MSKIPGIGVVWSTNASVHMSDNVSVGLIVHLRVSARPSDWYHL